MLAYLKTIETNYPTLDRGGFGANYREIEHPFDAGDVRSFDASLELLGTLKPTKTWANCANSYGLKHRVEDIHQTGNYLYCANGVMIAAVIHAGLKWRICSHERGDPNIDVKVSSNEVRKPVHYVHAFMDQFTDLEITEFRPTITAPRTV